MKEKCIKIFLYTVKILLLVSCGYSTYEIIGYWMVLSKKNFLQMSPSPTQEVGVLSGVSILVIVLWMLYFYLAASSQKRKWKHLISISSWDVFFNWLFGVLSKVFLVL